MRLLAAIEDPEVAGRILASLDRSARDPPPSGTPGAPEAPPSPDWPFEASADIDEP